MRERERPKREPPLELVVVTGGWVRAQSLLVQPWLYREGEKERRKRDQDEICSAIIPFCPTRFSRFLDEN